LYPLAELSQELRKNLIIDPEAIVARNSSLSGKVEIKGASIIYQSEVSNAEISNSIITEQAPGDFISGTPDHPVVISNKIVSFGGKFAAQIVDDVRGLQFYQNHPKTDYEGKKWSLVETPKFDEKARSAIEAAYGDVEMRGVDQAYPVPGERLEIAKRILLAAGLAVQEGDQTGEGVKVNLKKSVLKR